MSETVSPADVRVHKENPASLLEAVFRRIQAERMADVPILNPRLRVEAVKFAPWEGNWLGVLVTPWFMNLLILPGPDGNWVSLHEGEKCSMSFPSGVFKFIAGYEGNLGDHLTCSLFSPVLEFADQEAARLPAFAAFEALQNPEFAQPAEHTDRAGPATLARLEQPMSKRDFLKGAFLRSKAP